MGKVGGAHLNPAVTIAFAMRGNFSWRRTPGYVLAPVRWRHRCRGLPARHVGTAGHLGASLPGIGISPVQGLFMEVLLTVGLVSTMLGTALGAEESRFREQDFGRK
jgi:aquaporin Z